MQARKLLAAGKDLGEVKKAVDYSFRSRRKYAENFISDVQSIMNSPLRAVLAQCRKYHYYRVLRTWPSTMLATHPVLKKNLVTARGYVAAKLAKIKGPPQWFQDLSPALHNVRELLGKEAYSYLISLVYTIPYYRNAMREIAMFLCHSGLHDQGLAVFEALLSSYVPNERPPETQIVIYLQMLMFGSPEVQTNEKIYKEHVRWSQHFLQGEPYKAYTNPLTTNRRLKIGYTCHFITDSVATNSLHAMLRAHHRDRVEVFLYSDEPVNSKNEAIHGLVEHWRDTYGMDTDAFCELVRKDEIDVLVELNGHGIFHRYYAIALHPAPVQVAYYNYACTTGVPSMDYALIPGGIEIGHLQPYYSETIFHQKGIAHAMPVSDHFPPVSESPFEKNGFITFCSFGQAHKVSRQQILLWCEVLKRVPGSKFFMKARLLGEPASRAAFIHHFKDGGIDQSRLILEGNSDYATLLKCYWRADIGLDTYPCNAGTTSIEATISGVPIISLVGDRYCSQVARAVVESMGYPELQCQSPEVFIEKAVSLANNKQKLKSYRHNMRKDYMNNPRISLDIYATSMEDAYYEMWQRYIARYEKRAENIIKVTV